MMFGFSMFSSLFAIFFIGIIIAFVIFFIKGLAQWGQNNGSPVLTVEARCVAKRTSHSSGGTVSHHGGSTHYYATFEVESGDRMEFSVAGHEHGLLAEGDMGMLTFQGSRYHSFARDRVAKSISDDTNNYN